MSQRLIITELTSFAAKDVRNFTNVRFSNAVSITAESAAGKTETVKQLKIVAKGLLQPHTRFISGGALMRTRATRLGFQNIEAFCEHNREHPEDGHDLWLDTQLSMFATQNFHLVESRLAHVISPASCHVKLVCPLDIRAERRAKQLNLPLGEVRTMLEGRDKADNARYEVLYPGCLWPDAEFDAVIDTSKYTPEEVAQQIDQTHSQWLDLLGGATCHDVISPNW